MLGIRLPAVCISNMGQLTYTGALLIAFFQHEMTTFHHRRFIPLTIISFANSKTVCAR